MAQLLFFLSKSDELVQCVYLPTISVFLIGLQRIEKFVTAGAKHKKFEQIKDTITSHVR
jgi:hypothetical protein